MGRSEPGGEEINEENATPEQIGKKMRELYNQQSKIIEAQRQLWDILSLDNGEARKLQKQRDELMTEWLRLREILWRKKPDARPADY